jgi:AraC family transcriptional regulator
MTARGSRATYARRMHGVLEHIDRHLDEPLDLERLAGVAHFSPYHFYRLFAAWAGETVGDYLRRRRLEIGAMRLAAQPRLAVLEAALSVGFGSAEAFARAFKTRFGCAPSRWRMQQVAHRRHDSKASQADSKHDQVSFAPIGEPELSCHPTEETAMNVLLIERSPVYVAYLRHIGPYGEALSLFWRQTVYAWMRTHGLLGHARYGISHDDPGITAPAQCRYDACVEVPPDLAPTEDALATTLPGGRYAVLRFAGTAAEIPAAWAALLRDWLPDSGLQLDARPAFEHYPTDSTYDAQSGVFDCEICVPVAPL